MRLGEVTGGGPQCDRTGVLLRRSRELSASHAHTEERPRNSTEAAVRSPGEAPVASRHKPLLFQLPGLRHFVRAAPAH